MKLTCLILDDEAYAVEQLRRYVERIPTLDLKATFTDPNLAIAYLEREKVDLIFLDVEMPNFAIDGLDFIRLTGPDQHYIFTTAHPYYALPSYEYNTIDFLQKPIQFERFTKSVQKARQVLSATGSEPQEAYTYVRVEGSLQRIAFDDLYWIESERNGIWLTTELNRFNVSLSIGDMETRLPGQQFVRIHKSFIISLAKAQIIHKDSVVIERQGKRHEIPIGDAYKKDFIQRLENKISKRG